MLLLPRLCNANLQDLSDTSDLSVVDCKSTLCARHTAAAPLPPCEEVGTPGPRPECFSAFSKTTANTCLSIANCSAENSSENNSEAETGPLAVTLLLPLSHAGDEGPSCSPTADEVGTHPSQITARPLSPGPPPAVSQACLWGPGRAEVMLQQEARLRRRSRTPASSGPAAASCTSTPMTQNHSPQGAPV